MRASAQRKQEFLQSTLRTEDCIVCQKTGCHTADGWYTEASTEYDEDGAYLAGSGESLDDAAEIPAGWVCSKACRSQYMYEQAGPSGKETLRKVLDACRVLSEYGWSATRIVADGMDSSTHDLAYAARSFLEATCSDDDPAWTNRKAREEELEQAIRSARLELDIAASAAVIPAICAMKTDNSRLWNDYEVTRYAKNAASMGRVALDLRDALEAE